MDTPGLNDTDCCDSEIMDIIISKFQNDKSINELYLYIHLLKLEKLTKIKN
jgi:hypothetical protein